MWEDMLINPGPNTVIFLASFYDTELNITLDYGTGWHVYLYEYTCACMLIKVRYYSKQRMHQ